MVSCTVPTAALIAGTVSANVLTLLPLTPIIISPGSSAGEQLAAGLTTPSGMTLSFLIMHSPLATLPISNPIPCSPLIIVAVNMPEVGPAAAAGGVGGDALLLTSLWVFACVGGGTAAAGALVAVAVAVGGGVWVLVEVGIAFAFAFGLGFEFELGGL